MACGVCSTTGVMMLPASPSIRSGALLDVNPLSGAPLLPGQILVTGPDYTGPRVTVLDPNKPSSWPPWISSVNGKPVDDGTVPGGTYSAQQLPELTTTAKRVNWPWLLLLLLIVLAVVKGRKQ